MAGHVKADRYRLPGSSVLQLHPRECPATHLHVEVCQQYDPHSGAVAWCPFMYGLKIMDGWHRVEARTPRDAAAVMAAADDAPVQEYTVMCLRQTAALMTVGALRP